MELIDNLKKTSDKVDAFIRYTIAVFAAGFATLIFVSVLTRYVFHFSILFSVEASKIFFIWSCFLAATTAYKRQVHIRFEFASKLLGKPGIKATNVLIDISSLIFFVFLFVKSISFIHQIRHTIFPILGISQAWLYVAVAVSAAAFVIHNLYFLVEHIGDLKTSDSPGHVQ